MGQVSRELWNTCEVLVRYQLKEKPSQIYSHPEGHRMSIIQLFGRLAMVDIYSKMKDNASKSGLSPAGRTKEQIRQVSKFYRDQNNTCAYIEYGQHACINSGG